MTNNKSLLIRSLFLFFLNNNYFLTTASTEPTTEVQDEVASDTEAVTIDESVKDAPVKEDDEAGSKEESRAEETEEVTSELKDEDEGESEEKHSGNAENADDGQATEEEDAISEENKPKLKKEMSVRWQEGDEGTNQLGSTEGNSFFYIYQETKVQSQVESSKTQKMVLT